MQREEANKKLHEDPFSDCGAEEAWGAQADGLEIYVNALAEVDGGSGWLGWLTE